MEDETGTEGQVESTGAETNALGGTVTPPPAENPAWHDQLEKFPESVRHIARDAFQEWDQKTQARFTTIQEKYRPYQQFVDQGIPPERLQAAYGMAGLLESDPQGFARLLTEELGLTIQEAAAVAEEVQEQNAGNEEPLDPRMQALMEQQQQIMEFFQTQQEERQQQELAAQVQTQIDTEMQQIESQYGKMIPEVRNQVLAEALRLTNITGKPVSMTEAYESLNRFVEAVRSVPRPGQLAPRVMSGGNAVPLTPPGKSPGKMSDAETKNAAAEYIARQLAAG